MVFPCPTTLVVYNAVAPCSSQSQRTACQVGDHFTTPFPFYLDTGPANSLDWLGGTCRQVTFSYQQRGVEVLKGLSFQVREGEFLGPLVGGSQWFWGWSPEQAKQSHCQDGAPK